MKIQADNETIDLENQQISFMLKFYTEKLGLNELFLPRESYKDLLSMKPLKSNDLATSSQPLTLEDSSFKKNYSQNDLSWHLAPQQIKRQLDTLQKQVQLTYNDFVQSYIDAYTSTRYRNHISNMLALAEYYFPIYEKVFDETGVPQEIKYLSIIESALNPHAVSRFGATGPWQFMFATAKSFNLNIDNYVDERKDPYAASYAAAAYLKDAFNEFGDWQLAIASYNCGKGNVTRAIQRSGIAQPDFWSIRKFLPQETRNYVPAFIAMTYVLNQCDLLGIAPSQNAALADGKGTDVILIDKFVSLAGIAEALQIDLNKLVALNPAYKKNLINGTPESPKRLVVPSVDKLDYASLYTALSAPSADDKVMAPLLASYSEEPPSSAPLYHKVKRGESLNKIANQYHVEVQDLKVWNNLKRRAIVPGQRLKIRNNTPMSAGRSAIAKKKVPSYITYKVKRGDTLSEIAQKYRGASIQSIKAINNLKGSSLHPGTVLKISKL